MADLKISALPASTTPLAGTEVVPLVQSGTTKNVSVSNLTAGRTVQAASFAANTASPRGVVSANGNTASQPAIGSATGSLFAMTAANNYGVIGGVNAAGNSWFQAGRVDGTPTAYDVYWQVTGGYMGVGTATPPDKFSVADGNIRAVDGNFVQGTAGKGVNFTANTPAAGMTSQLLNAYEEGTWTPEYQGSVSNPTVGYAEQDGYYTRIGNVVTFVVRLRISSLSGGSGDLRITLPFTTKTFSNNNIVAGGGSVAFSYDFTQNPQSIYVFPNVNYFNMRATPSDLNLTQVSNLQNPCYLNVSGYFFV